jgi:hypothetical protein
MWRETDQSDRPRPQAGASHREQASKSNHLASAAIDSDCDWKSEKLGEILKESSMSYALELPLNGLHTTGEQGNKPSIDESTHPMKENARLPTGTL